MRLALFAHHAGHVDHDQHRLDALAKAARVGAHLGHSVCRHRPSLSRTADLLGRLEPQEVILHGPQAVQARGLV